jgi:multicomponent Na+:H+ antiporter subunit B
MNSLILKIAVRVLFPVILVVSLYVLFRGHHEPGGGFIGGLIAASALVLKTFVFGLEETERIMRIKPIVLIISGLTIAFSASLIPVFLGYNFFEGLWAGFSIPFIGKPGTPLLFDIGVYLVVIGIVSKIIFSIGD